MKRVFENIDDFGTIVKIRAFDLQDYNIDEICLKTKKGHLFESLFYYGKWMDRGYRSKKDAQIHLYEMLTVYTRDIYQVERMFSKSALCSEKWKKCSAYREEIRNAALERTNQKLNEPSWINCNFTEEIVWS
ncbi:hypothetical protein SAMN04488589_1741 [Methanolobus vulcani]|uniref:Uncharacterized protein n=1 Tax=Methanolobus vulcani TaxID=38026 RepID=A0A7Z7FEJ0_9EURY|nr:hypothetical protein [Methanolobus vulcani]SDF93638.1 hypothetical protein SAMN04488589_1741 [Methanolobus vulcani]